MTGGEQRRKPPIDPEDAALLACRLCVAAYERAKLRGGGIDWDDIEAAYVAARAALVLAAKQR
jgi:hypothetical protein